MVVILMELVDSCMVGSLGELVESWIAMLVELVDSWKRQWCSGDLGCNNGVVESWAATVVKLVES